MKEFVLSANAALRGSVPAAAALNLILLVILLAWNGKAISGLLGRIDRKTLLLAVAVTLFAFALRMLVPHHQHITFADEHDYMLAAKTLLEEHSQGWYTRCIGWPLLLAVSFGIFGVSPQAAINTSAALGAATVFAFFLLAYSVTKKERLSLAGALIFSVLPVHIRWSACAETNVASLFAIIAVMFFCFLYFESGKASLLWLCAAGLAFVCQFRPENNFYPLLFLAGCAIFKGGKRGRIAPAAIIPAALILALALPNLAQISAHQLFTDWIASDTGGLMTGDNWSLYNLLHNSYRYGWEIFSGKLLPIPVTILAAAGAWRMCALVEKRKEFLFLAVWFCMLWLAYFSSWMQTLQGRDRFHMSFYPIIIIFACYGFEYVAGFARRQAAGIRFPARRSPAVIMAVLVLSFIPWIVISRFMYADEQSRLETRLPDLAKRDIPADYIIIANWPQILKATTDLRVIRTSDLLENPGNRKLLLNCDCALFLEDKSCGPDELGKANCERVLKEFTAVPYKSYREGRVKYTFYKLSGKFPAGSTGPGKIF
ncbi:MAG: glycosyltransferase family 39 protein [bacterium]